MSFEDLLKKLNKINLPNDQFVVIGSGPLGVRNIRQSQDLDLLVTSALWNKLIKVHKVVNEYGMEKIKIDEGVEVSGNGSAFIDPNIASVEEIIQSADVVEGIRYINLELLKKFKQKMSREKDFKDVILIDEYLSLSKV